MKSDIFLLTRENSTQWLHQSSQISRDKIIIFIFPQNNSTQCDKDTAVLFNKIHLFFDKHGPPEKYEITSDQTNL